MTTMKKRNKKRSLSHILRIPNTNLSSFGWLDEAVVSEIKETCSAYPYIEIVWEHYSDKEKPQEVNWIDVEGMGYGFHWIGVEPRDWHDMMVNLVRVELERLMEAGDQIPFVSYQRKGIQTYHFVLNKTYRKDVIIHFSNQSLY